MDKLSCIILILKYSLLALGAMESNLLNINDILNDDLMPTMLFLEGDETYPNIVNKEVNNTILDKIDKIEDDGTFNSAYSTMGFHRQKINEYLCSHFIADQILSDIVPSRDKVFERRIGVSVDDDGNKTLLNNLHSRQGRTDAMLFDVGSSGYKNWLSKTTTLEDIYRHYTNNPYNQISNITLKRNDARSNNNRRQDAQVHENRNGDDYEEGEVTGYAMSRPAENFNSEQNLRTENRFENLGSGSDFMEYPQPTADSKTAGLSPGYIYPNPIQNFLDGKNNFFQHPIFKIFHNNHPNYQQPNITSINQELLIGEGYYPSAHDGGYEVHDYGNDKGMSNKLGLKDIFEIALTTLAFLSFGMFILQVIMCITMTKTDNNMMMMPMELEETDVEILEPEVRHKRSAEYITNNFNVINEISRKVLFSIEAAIISKKDNGKCLRRVLCDINKYSRKQENGQKIWIPVWGLGLSWLSSRFINNQPPMSAILESLKASAMGLGNADCVRTYTNCTMNLFHLEKEKRRKKREINNYKFQWNI